MKKSTLLMPGLSLVFIFISIANTYANPPQAYEGRRLYVSYCQLCHGVNGQGDGPLAKVMKIKPAALTTTVRARSDTILKKIITGKGKQTITGRNRHNLLSEAMPEWKDIFSEEQLQALIAYLRFMTNTSKHPLMGDPVTGMKLYQKYCQVCHGEEGDGEGIMTQLMGITPMDHTNPNETNPLSNQDIINSIMQGKGRYMPAWEGILSRQDAEALVSYIRLLAH